MKDIDFNNKTFSLVENSEKGTVNSDTIFVYKQEGKLVTADYYGGTIVYGKIIATYDDGKLDMRYQCLTIDNELKAGKADAIISITEFGKVKLQLHWEWLDKKKESGYSEYLEN